MKPYREMSKEELASLKEQLTAVYKEYQGRRSQKEMRRCQRFSSPLLLRDVT